MHSCWNSAVRPDVLRVLLANIHELLSRQANRPVPLLGRIALRRGRLALCQGQDDKASGFFQSGLEDCPAQSGQACVVWFSRAGASGRQSG